MSWYGTPYVHKGRVKGVGCDCGGFIYEVFNPFVGPFPAFPTDYPPDWALHNDNELYLDFILPFVREIPRPKAGGLTLYHIGKRYAHAALMLENGNYIHSWGRQGSCGVTITPPRVMRQYVRNYGNGFREKHFEAIGG